MKLPHRMTLRFKWGGDSPAEPASDRLVSHAPGSRAAPNVGQRSKGAHRFLSYGMVAEGAVLVAMRLGGPALAPPKGQRSQRSCRINLVSLVTNFFYVGSGRRFASVISFLIYDTEKLV